MATTNQEPVRIAKPPLPIPWRRWAIVLIPGVVLYFVPLPGFSPIQRHLLAVFLATVISLVAQPVPMGVTVMTALAVLGLTRTVAPNKVLSGFSKSHAMTGWRIGYAAGPQPLLDAMRKVHQYTIMSAPTMAQVAALEAICNADSDVEAMRTAAKAISRPERPATPARIPARDPALTLTQRIHMAAPRTKTRDRENGNRNSAPTTRMGTDGTARRNAMAAKRTRYPVPYP